MVALEKQYDFAIVGAGCAGLSAGIYASRFGLKSVVLAKEFGGLVTTASMLENWPGEKAITGMDLAQKLQDHLSEYPVPLMMAEVASARREADGTFTLETSEGTTRAKAILLATGSSHRKLGVKGEKEFAGKGVSYCAVCDGPMFKNKAVAVIGGSDSAAKEALMLAEHASKVFMIYRGEKLRAEPITLSRVESNKKIEVIYDTNVVELVGQPVPEVSQLGFENPLAQQTNQFKQFPNVRLGAVKLDRDYNGSRTLALSGVFVAIGHLPNSSLAAALGAKLTEKGEISVNRSGETSVPGLYAAGDVIDFEFKQAITGAAQGVTAAWAAYGYLSKKQAKKS